MIEILCGIISFVTATVSYLYGIRIAWGCGKQCHFKESSTHRKQLLSMYIPAATALHLFGFLILYRFLFDGFATLIVSALTSAILFSLLLVSMAMPELKRNPQAPEGIRHRPHREHKSGRNDTKGLAFGYDNF